MFIPDSTPEEIEEMINEFNTAISILEDKLYNEKENLNELLAHQRGEHEKDRGIICCACGFKL